MVWWVAGLVVGCAGHWLRSAGAVLASSITLKELLGTWRPITFSSSSSSRLYSNVFDWRLEVGHGDMPYT